MSFGVFSNSLLDISTSRKVSGTRPCRVPIQRRCAMLSREPQPRLREVLRRTADCGVLREAIDGYFTATSSSRTEDARGMSIAELTVLRPLLRGWRRLQRQSGGATCIFRMLDNAMRADFADSECETLHDGLLGRLDDLVCTAEVEKQDAAQERAELGAAFLRAVPPVSNLHYKEFLVLTSFIFSQYFLRFYVQNVV